MSYRYTPEDKEALEFCNSVRVLMDKEPVRHIRKGKKGSYCSCPIAKTISGVRVAARICRQGCFVKCFISEIPAHISTWIEEFDSGKLPHFIEGDTNGC